MNAIVGFSQLVHSDNNASENQRYTNIIQKNSDHLLRLINDIIDLSKIEAGDMEMEYSDFNIRDVFTELMEYYSLELLKRGKSDISLDYSIPEGDMIIHSDAIRIKQALSNLLDNALKYTPHGGTVKVIVDEDTDQVMVSVNDDGIGISRDDLPNIFKRFYRGDSSRSQSGSGLGLSLVHSIVQAHRGRVEVESSLGRGSTFKVQLPRV